MITTMNYRNEKNIPFDDPNGQQFDYLETERLRLRKLTPTAFNHFMLPSTMKSSNSFLALSMTPTW